MFGSLAPVLIPLVTWLVPVVLVAWALYAVVRRGVRDAILDVRRIDAAEAAERRDRAARLDPERTAGTAPGPGADPH